MQNNMIQEELITLSLPYYTGQNKTVRVYVPEHKYGEKLPVIYMSDGQNLFEDDRPHQFGCWYTREAIQEEQKAGKAAIVVGIHNDEDPVQRACELTPAEIGAIRYPADIPQMMRDMMIPQGEAFDTFLLDTVMQEIERRFPVMTGKASTAFCGSSSGGLQAYFTVLSHPDRFGMGGVFSPAFPLYDTADIIRWTKEKTIADAPFLFLYSGADDPLEQEICESTQAVYEGIKEFYPAEKIKETILPEQRHHESAWARQFKEMLHLFLSSDED